MPQLEALKLPHSRITVVSWGMFQMDDPKNVSQGDFTLAEPARRVAGT